MKNKLLIIGHTGFVGTNITEYLKLHYDIYGLSRNDIYGLSKNDIYNKYDFNTFFAIIFLAGLAHDEDITNLILII
jgi:nucleoside-diphosphate-sugar epimerase